MRVPCHSTKTLSFLSFLSFFLFLLFFHGPLSCSLSHRFTEILVSSIYLLTTHIPEWLWEWWSLLSGKLRWTSISANKIQHCCHSMNAQSASKNRAAKENSRWRSWSSGQCSRCRYDRHRGRATNSLNDEEESREFDSRHSNRRLAALFFLSSYRSASTLLL